MQLTGELAALAYAHRETEFIIPTGSTTRIYGACGPDALASCASAARGHLVTCETVYATMRAHGLCDGQGVTTDGKLAQAVPYLGLTIMEHRRYAEPWAAWPNFLGWHLASNAHPVLLQVANGQALRDDISGMGENATNLKYHFIMLLKRHNGGPSAYAGGRTLRAGYWACDGDSFAGGNDRAHGYSAADVLQFYPDTVLAAARPCAGIAFARVPPPPPPPPPPAPKPPAPTPPPTPAPTPKPDPYRAAIEAIKAALAAG